MIFSILVTGYSRIIRLADTRFGRETVLRIAKIIGSLFAHAYGSTIRVRQAGNGIQRVAGVVASDVTPVHGAAEPAVGSTNRTAILSLNAGITFITIQQVYITINFDARFIICIVIARITDNTFTSALAADFIRFAALHDRIAVISAHHAIAACIAVSFEIVTAFAHASLVCDTDFVFCSHAFIPDILIV